MIVTGVCRDMVQMKHKEKGTYYVFMVCFSKDLQVQITENTALLYSCDLRLHPIECVRIIVLCRFPNRNRTFSY